MALDVLSVRPAVKLAVIEGYKADAERRIVLENKLSALNNAKPSQVSPGHYVVSFANGEVFLTMSQIKATKVKVAEELSDITARFKGQMATVYNVWRSANGDHGSSAA